MELRKILYATISNFELEERLRRDDDMFDAWEYLAEKIGHKNTSTLRKMCQRRNSGNIAKLGLEEAITIMNITHDYRMLTYFINQLKAAALTDRRQEDLFSQASRTIADAMRERRNA